MRGDKVVSGGVLLVDKPTGITSAAVVQVVKRVLGRPKIGHLGTLDPFASGLLPLCVGEGTKLAPYLNTTDKHYRGVVRLGLTSDTLDITGAILTTAAAPDPSSIDLEALASAFTGVQQQIPPAFSAIKRQGTPLYKLARRGETVELEPREVVIHALLLERIDAERIGLDLHCSKGTYVRSLARDLGERIGCGALLEELVRTQFGPFNLGAAVSLADLESQRGAALAAAAMIPASRALAHLPAIEVDRGTAASLRTGRQQALATAFAGASAEVRAATHARVVDPEDVLVAVICGQGGGWKLGRVFRDLPGCDASCGD